MDLVNIFIKGVFIDNMIFAYFLGMCSYLAVSKTVTTANGLGLAVIFVLGITVPVNYILENFILSSGALHWLGDDFINVDLNVTNKQLWPFDFAAFTLVSVKDEKNKLGQIDPYKGKNTVKYGIENEEKVNVELVYEFDHSPREINIICKSTMALNADSVLFVQTF